MSSRDSIDLKSLPNKTGVYLMKNADRRIIYIGKAKDLKKRVQSYFTRSNDLKTRVLMERVANVETITTGNEYEALLLENTLIKQWKPRYNINLKDGKSYPVIRITNEDFPRVFRTRRIIFDGSDYYGPYPNAMQLDHYLALIEKLFPLRKCRGKLKTRQHPCLYFHIGRCSAPCCNRIGKEEYNQNVDKIRTLLTGDTDRLIRELVEKRDEAAGQLAFEEAAVIRDQIKTIQEVSQGQQVLDRNEKARDYIGYTTEDTLCSFVILQMRGGALVGKEVFRTEIFSEPEEALNQFVIQYYGKIHNPPQKLYLRAGEDTKALSSYLTDVLKRKLQVVIRPLKGDRRILEMAEENSRDDIAAWARDRQKDEDLARLRTDLKLRKTPRRIEGFDIAHLSGRNTVGSMVTFLNGKPEKSGYRYFKIRSLQGKVDDYEAMREIVARRYTRVVNEELDRPDLILVDGGKGQVNAARSILESIGLGAIPLAGLAKQREEIFLPGQKQPIRLEEGSSGLRILQAVRDESHRFATNYHKRLRDARLGHSILEEVRGIGKRRAQKLLQTFGSLRSILNSSPEELFMKAGITRDTAQSLIEFLKSKDQLIPTDSDEGWESQISESEDSRRLKIIPET
jgi:excinuclease ABC subunit C